MEDNNKGPPQALKNNNMYNESCVVMKKSYFYELHIHIYIYISQRPERSTTTPFLATRGEGARALFRAKILTQSQD